MALWGNIDQANNSPIFGPSYVNKSPNETNRDNLFENDTPDAFITGQTIGVFGNQEIESGPSGWVLKRTGSGGRAGRVMTEILVAMSSVESFTFSSLLLENGNKLLQENNNLLLME